IRVDNDLHNLSSVEAEFPTIVINDAVAPLDELQCKSQKNSFSYKMISVNDLKTDSENDYDKVMPSIPSPEPAISCFDDFFTDFENKFLAIVYNDAQMSKSDLLTEPILNPLDTDIQEKEQKESQKQTNPSTGWKGQSQKSSQMKKLQLEGLKLPNLKLYYKR
ncbi:hypothetical protein Tco_0933419, partial [Tanacetum coccineum]